MIFIQFHFICFSSRNTAIRVMTRTYIDVIKSTAIFCLFDAFVDNWLTFSKQRQIIVNKRKYLCTILKACTYFTAFASNKQKWLKFHETRWRAYSVQREPFPYYTHRIHIFYAISLNLQREIKCNGIYTRESYTERNNNYYYYLSRNASAAITTTVNRETSPRACISAQRVSLSTRSPYLRRKKYHDAPQ